jgi:hypothetical protein
MKKALNHILHVIYLGFFKIIQNFPIVDYLFKETQNKRVAYPKWS